MTARRTALAVVVHEADQLVADYRRRYDSDAVARRIPPHVTVVFPFAPAESATADLLASLRGLYAEVPAFEFALVRVDRFEEHVWLAPDPSDRFVALTALTAARFPHWPPYGGAFEKVIPHLTVGCGKNTDAMASAAHDEIGSGLPLPGTAHGVTLLEEQADGTWAELTTFALGAR